MNGYGANAEAGAGHYIAHGRFEGRSVSFDGLEYIASYGDLMGGYGADDDTGAVALHRAWALRRQVRVFRRTGVHRLVHRSDEWLRG